jgi:hypothetical protein
MYHYVAASYQSHIILAKDLRKFLCPIFFIFFKHFSSVPDLSTEGEPHIVLQWLSSNLQNKFIYLSVTEDIEEQ